MSVLRKSLHNNRVFTQEKCGNRLFIREKLRGRDEQLHPMLMHTYTFTYTRPHKTPSLSDRLFFPLLTKDLYYRRTAPTHTSVSSRILEVYQNE